MPREELLPGRLVLFFCRRSPAASLDGPSGQGMKQNSEGDKVAEILTAGWVPDRVRKKKKKRARVKAPQAVK